MTTKAEADELSDAPKRIHESFEWEWDGQKHVGSVSVECLDRDDVLRLVAWKNERGYYSFSLLHRNSITIRRWDDHPGHENPDDTPIDGPHKHYHVDGYEDEWAYETDDVTTNNVRQAFFDFLDEESIELGENAAFQDTIGEPDG